jgi:hypothetical protein
MGKITDGCDKAEFIYMECFGRGMPTWVRKHLCECDICYRNFEFYYGTGKSITLESLRPLVKQLKSVNYDLSDKEFEILLFAKQHVAATAEETHTFRESAVPGFSELFKKLETILADVPEPVPF